MNTVKITPVVENTTPTGIGMIGEHGLSFHIENNNEEILFDTGQGLALKNNMKILGKDLSRINKTIISHGHYDHTGGLEDLAEKSKFMLYGHLDIFLPKFASYDEVNFFNIGCPFSRDFLEKKGVNFNLDTKPVNIAENITTTGEIPFSNDFEKIEPYFYTENNQGQKVKDKIPDDLGIIIDTPSGIVLILGCTHRGIINTIDHVSELTGSKKFHTIMGGLHLESADENKMAKIIKNLKKYEIKNLVTGHCTGRYAQVQLASASSLNHQFIRLGKPYIF
ncbi:MAG: MBL fold metallo-hydrolase [Deltaproteobacteria bacterium]|nr:MAG: MBL fold metallo-hydrolase [Deltaproteobacteria bacterium]